MVESISNEVKNLLLPGIRLFLLHTTPRGEVITDEVRNPPYNSSDRVDIQMAACYGRVEHTDSTSPPRSLRQPGAPRQDESL